MSSDRIISNDIGRESHNTTHPKVSNMVITANILLEESMKPSKSIYSLCVVEKQANQFLSTEKNISS